MYSTTHVQEKLQLLPNLQNSFVPCALRIKSVQKYIAQKKYITKCSSLLFERFLLKRL